MEYMSSATKIPTPDRTIFSLTSQHAKARDSLKWTHSRMEINSHCGASNNVRFAEYIIAYEWLYIPFDTNIYIEGIPNVCYQNVIRK
jgi:hypothetical protein